MRERARISAVVVALACAAGIGSAVAAGAGEDRDAGLVLASGRLTDSAGRPQAGVVRAYAWPVDGRRTRSLPLAASTSTDESGRFTLRARDAQRLARLSRKKGSVDLLVVGTTRSGQGDTVFSSRVARRGGALAASAANGSRRTPSIHVATRAGARAASHDCKDYGDVGAPKVTKVRSYKRPVTIGELNNAYPDTRATFSYGRKADSEVSVGFSRNGSDWSLEGSTHVGNSRSVTLSITRRGPYSKRLRTNFIFTKYKTSLCAAPGHPDHYYRVRAEEWSGGLSGRIQAGTLGVCLGGNDYPRNSTFDRDSKRAVVWRRGASVAGIGLSTRSGFSHWVRTSYHFGRRAQKHRLCGSGNRSETTAGRIYSGAGRSRP